MYEGRNITFSSRQSWTRSRTGPRRHWTKSRVRLGLSMKVRKGIFFPASVLIRRLEHKFFSRQSWTRSRARPCISALRNTRWMKFICDQIARFLTGHIEVEGRCDQMIGLNWIMISSDFGMILRDDCDP
jgi:hypothetical protein